MTDLIKRADAIKAMADYLDLLGVARRYAKSVINKVPSAEKQGEWIDCKGGWKCTARNKWSDSTYNFCPNCGARMLERSKR